MRHFSLSFKNSKLTIIDQAKLPLKVEYIEIKNILQSFQALRSLKVRGAPLIGVFAGYSIYISIKDASPRSKDSFLKKFSDNIDYLRKSRPTAVNLFWALERIKNKVYRNLNKSVAELKKMIKAEAQAIHQEDITLCSKIGEFGARLIRSHDSILTHCNAGFLATSGEGTALSIIYKAHQKYKNIKVYADETRPLLQGARLTSWELSMRGVKVILICDNMAAALMKKGLISKVIVGADRITKDGCAANKIGTYNLAVLCRYHNIPFYIAAPSTTFDPSLLKGRDIPIEQRSPEEVRTVFGKRIAPVHVKTCNPAFDVTPGSLITAFITEKGIITKPFRKNIALFLEKTQIKS